MKIKWKNLSYSSRKNGFGHGIEFHDLKRKEGDTLIAFLDGYDWYHDDPGLVRVYCLEPDTISDKEVIESLKLIIIKIIDGKKIVAGKLDERFYANPNG